MAFTQARDDDRFELYIALRRFRTELWRSLPPLVFIRWMFNKQPWMVIPCALLLGVTMLSVLAFEVWL